MTSLNQSDPLNTSKTMKQREGQIGPLTGSLDVSVSKFLREHVLFKDVKDENFIEKLASSLQIRMYADRDTVIKKGEVGRAMFFILRGQIEVVSDDGETTKKIMTESEFFGEIGVLFSVPRTVTCRARGRCLLLILTKDALAKASDEYPKVAEQIALIAQERFSSYVKQKDSAVNMDFGEEIKLGMTQVDLQKVPFFRDCEVGFLHMLALSLTPIQYHQNDLIIRKGDKASEMYFVVRGVAEVFNEDDGKVYAQFTPGSFFGEVGLFFDIKRTASVHCVSDIVDVFKLTRDDLDMILENYPEVAQKIKVEAKQRFLYNQEREKIKLSQRRKLQTEHEVIREKLKTIPFFKDASIGFLHQLALMVKFRDFKNDEIIIRKDDTGDSMFFILDGEALVISQDGRQIFAELGANSFFGEVSLFYSVHRTATVRAKVFTTVIEISKTVLETVLEQHPELKSTMMKKAKENYDLFLQRQKALKELKAAAKQDVDEYEVEATVQRLKKVPLFENCQSGFLRMLALSTSIKKFNRGDLIVKKGDTANEMFFIAEGNVEIMSESGEVFDIISQGNFFGEVGIIKSMQRTASVRVSSASCTVIILSASSLKKFVKEYPESFQSIAIECEKRMQKIQERTSTDMTIPTEDIGRTMTRGPIHTADEFTDAIKVNKKERMSLTKIFRNSGKEGTRSRSFSSNDDESIAEAQSEELKKSTSQDSIRDPEPKKGMKIGSVNNSSQQPNSLLSDPVQPPEIKNKEDKIRNGPFGKFITSIKNTMTRRPATSKVGPTKSKQTGINESTVFESVYKTAFEHILDFNDSDLSLILSQVPPLEKIRLRQVCRRWSEIMHQSYMWKNVDLQSMFRTLNADKMFIFCELGGESIQVLNLRNCWQILDEDLKMITSSCPNLTSLCLSNCWKISDKGVGYISQNCTRLTDLDLSYCGQLSFGRFQDHRMALLRKINFSFCKQLGDEHLEALLSKTTNIRWISFRRCTRITDFGLFLVVRYCRRLQYLDLNDCDHISDKCLKWIASSCTALTHLNLRFCTRITNGGLYDLSLGVQNFKSLKLSHCTQLTDASIIFFSDNIKDLQYIYLRRCRKITETTANYLAKTCHKLRILDLSGCPHVSSATRHTVQNLAPSIEIKIDLSRKERGVKNPVERGVPVATEVSIPKKFTSGPRDVMLGLVKSGKSGPVSEGVASSSSKKKKGHKGSGAHSTGAMID